MGSSPTSGLTPNGCAARRGGADAEDRWERLGTENVSLSDDVLAGMGSGTPGLLITFEGVDGSGKTTQLALLAEELRAGGHDVLVTREPGGTAVGERVREALLDTDHRGMSAHAEALLYAAARAQLVEEVVRPALQAGRIVLCDRFLDSSLAYQGFGRELGVDNIMMLNVWGTDCLFPDLTLVFVIGEETRRARRAGARSPGAGGRHLLRPGLGGLPPPGRRPPAPHPGHRR